MTAALFVGAVLAVGCVGLVALPFLREPRSQDGMLVRPDELEQRRRALSEERDRALAALKELEFDHRTGKVSEDDYREVVGPLRRRAAEALRALDVRAAQPPVRGSGPGEGVWGNREVVPPATEHAPRG